MDTLTHLTKTTKYPLVPSVSILEVFDKPTYMQGLVSFECTEFTSVCPVTGQPDFGSWIIEYQPFLHCLEAKSLKLYLGAYRQESGFWETLAVRIVTDLKARLNPHWLCVTGRMNTRGGIAMVVTETRGTTVRDERG